MPCAVRFVDGTIELRQDRLEGEEICLHITSLRHYLVVPLPCMNPNELPVFGRRDVLTMLPRYNHLYL